MYHHRVASCETKIKLSPLQYIQFDASIQKKKSAQIILKVRNAITWNDDQGAREYYCSRNVTEAVGKRIICTSRHQRRAFIKSKSGSRQSLTRKKKEMKDESCSATRAI